MPRAPECVQYQTGAIGSERLPLCLSRHQCCRVFGALLETEVQFVWSFLWRCWNHLSDCSSVCVESHWLTTAILPHDQNNAEPDALILTYSAKVTLIQFSNYPRGVNVIFSLYINCDLSKLYTESQGNVAAPNLFLYVDVPYIMKHLKTFILTFN